jgi:putative transposase
MTLANQSSGGPRSVVAGGGDGRDEARPSRRTPARQPIHEVVNRSSIVFLTVCSQDRRPLFDKPDIHDLLRSAWTAADAWRVGRYVLMPDHIHLFCAPARHDYPSLHKWVQYWKSVASRQWPRPQEHPIWQKSSWDTQLRQGESYAEKWEYVRRNPLRAGLCRTLENWPFQGEMNVLMWHD